MSGEFELIAELTEGLSTGADVLLGVGDDAALLRNGAELAISTDILVENVHFRRAWSSAEQIGRKSIAVNVSDIEAMGARPSAVVVALAFPKDTPRDWLRGFSSGVRAECELAGVSLVGGDLSRSEQVVVSVTAVGEISGHKPVLRSGAQPDDVVALAGRIGWSGAGHAALSRGFRSPLAVVQAAHCPEVPYGQGRVAAQAGATAMIDISDGLVQDLGHIAHASAVQIDLQTELLELAEPIERVAAAIGKDPLEFLLAGGEDYALAATFPSTADLPKSWRVIGKVKEGNGVLVDGSPSELVGWDHFD